MAGFHKKLSNLFHKKKPSRFRSWLFLGIGALAIAASGFLLFATPVLTPTAAAILPGQNLTFYAEFDRVDCSEAFTRKAPEVCRLREAAMNALIGDIPERISTFADHMALASYSSTTGGNVGFNPVIALRVINSRLAEQYVRSLNGFDTAQEEIRNGTRVLSFLEPTTRSVFLWKGWLLFSPEPGLLDRLITVQDESMPAVQESDLLVALAEKLPQQANIRILAESPAFTPLLPAVVAPLANFIPQFGIGITEQTEQLLFDVVASAPELPQRTMEPQAGEDGLQKLISSMPADDNLLLFGAVRDFKRELEWAFSYLEATDPAFGLSLRGQARTYLTKLFGSGISLENDVLPLLENEFVMTLSASPANASPTFFIAADTKDSEFAESKQQKFLTAMKNAAAAYVPRVLEHTLDDGTVIKEVSACVDCVQEQSEAVGGGTVTTFLATDQSDTQHRLTLGMIDGTIIATDDEQKGKGFLESHQKLGQKTPMFLLELDNIRDKAEIIVIKPAALQKISQRLANTLKDFESLVLAREQSESIWHIRVQANYAL